MVPKIGGVLNGHRVVRPTIGFGAKYLDVAEDGTITRFDKKAAFLLA